MNYSILANVLVIIVLPLFLYSSSDRFRTLSKDEIKQKLYEKHQEFVRDSIEFVKIK